MRRLASSALVGASLFAGLFVGVPRPAAALEAGELAGDPVTTDITNTAVGPYHFDNRNSQVAAPTTRVDDRYVELLDRFDLQVGWRHLRLGVRLDAALYGGYPDNEALLGLARDDAARLRAQGTDPGSLNDRANQYYRELNTRYLDTLYPSKLSLQWTEPGLEATVGDFYVNLGRGLVFSVRKIDELAIDTTVRGGRLAGDVSLGSPDYHLKGMAFVGQLNPVRLDEASGRRLHGTSDPLFFGFPRAPDFQYFLLAPDGTPVSLVDRGRPSYLEDTAYGGHVELATPLGTFGGNVALLSRLSHAADHLACLQRCAAEASGASQACAARCEADFPDFSANDPSRLHATIRSFSGTLFVPSLGGHGDAYLEVAGQQLRDGKVTTLDPSGAPGARVASLSGYAIYANVSLHEGPVTLSLEGKHYRRFFPLSANVDLVTPGFSAPELAVIGYNQAPTAEPIYVEQIGSPNNCITGGRAKLDYRHSPDLLFYGWLGRYTSHSELDSSNVRCDATTDATTGQVRDFTDDEYARRASNTWDAAAGTELRFGDGRSHVFAWAGARLTDLEHAAPSHAGDTTAFYREGYLRYDLALHLTGPFALQFQGFHRRRYQPIEVTDWWHEGENYTALQWSPHLSAIFGWEYLAKSGCATNLDASAAPTKLCQYVSGGLQWRSRAADDLWLGLVDTVNVFVGQRRGAVRCVSGVCRQFPPFEGARIEVVSRF